MVFLLLFYVPSTVCRFLHYCQPDLHCFSLPIFPQREQCRQADARVIDRKWKYVCINNPQSTIDVIPLPAAMASFSEFHIVQGTCPNIFHPLCSVSNMTRHCSEVSQSLRSVSATAQRRLPLVVDKGRSTSLAMETITVLNWYPILIKCGLPRINIQTDICLELVSMRVNFDVFKCHTYCYVPICYGSSGQWAHNYICEWNIYVQHPPTPSYRLPRWSKYVNV